LYPKGTTWPKAKYYKVNPRPGERSWRGLQGYYECLRPKVSKYIAPMLNFPPVPPEGFKPFGFRKTVLDSITLDKEFSSKGIGQFGYLKIVNKQLLILRTNNYYLALSKTRRCLDFQPPKQTSYSGLDIVEFTKWKLLRSLENFVHFAVHYLPTKTNFIVKLSLTIRRYLRCTKYTCVYRELSPLNLKGKWRKPTELTYPFPTIRPVTVRTGALPKAKTNKLDQGEFNSLGSDSGSSEDSSDYIMPKASSSGSSSDDSYFK